MSTPQYQFNLGSADPLLSNPNYMSPDIYANSIEQEIQRLNAYKQQIMRNNNVAPAENIWDSIDKEISNMSDKEKEILAQDETYSSIEQELQFMIQQELINSVKNKVANSPHGRELLEKQYNNIKEKKNIIKEQSNKELELFKKFQVAVQANPNLTYKEFVKTLK